MPSPSRFPLNLERSPLVRGVATSRPKVLQFFKERLDSFRSSQEQLQILCEAPRQGYAPSTTRDAACPAGGEGNVKRSRSKCPQLPRRTVILDSSFNPPTKAHMQMAVSAIREATRDGKSARLLLLLAVNNADKAPKPASFEQRLAMMDAFARDVYEELSVDHDAGGRVSVADCEGDEGKLFGVDLALTALPYFHDKSAALAAAVQETSSLDELPRGERQPVEQLFLIGYDTLVRLFNPKYYTKTTSGEPVGDGMREALSPLFGRARIRLTLRTDADWGDRREQLAYVEDITHGTALAEAGGLKEWAGRIDIAETTAEDNDAQGAISSTFARDAAAKKDWARLGTMVPLRVAAWVQAEQLYGETA